jgi:hypothetical protein
MSILITTERCAQGKGVDLLEKFGGTLPECSRRMGFRLAPAALREHPMTQRIAVAEKTRERLRALIDGRLGTGADRSDLVRMAVQLIVEEVREGEARDSQDQQSI